MSHWYTDRLMHGQPHFIIVDISLYTCMLCLHITVTCACHVYLSLLHVHVMLTYHCYTCMSCLHITVTPACYIFLSLFHLQSMFHVPVFMLYDCFLLLIWIFPLLDMRAVDMRYVESHIYCSRFLLYCFRDIIPVPVILFYAINRAQVQLSYYPYLVLYLFFLHCILDMLDHKDNLGMGET